MDKKPLIIISGPTAVGKTDISIKLAKRINGEIISADSIQVYKGMDIGSAKITKEEMENIPHFLIDVLDPNEEFNVFVFKKLALKAVDEIINKGKIPIIVGGTGFYIQALLYDIDFTKEDTNTEIREELYKLYEKNGVTFLHNMLKEIDPEAAEAIHENNVKRVIRAIEYFRLSGEKISTHNKEQRENEAPFNFKYFVLNKDREVLYDLINKRVDIMFDKGIIDEVKALLNNGYSKDLTSMQGIGYKEVCSYLDGEISLEECKDIIKKNSRHFAKRQLTWFRREKELEIINYEDFANDKNLIVDHIIDVCSKNNIK